MCYLMLSIITKKLELAAQQHRRDNYEKYCPLRVPAFQHQRWSVQAFYFYNADAGKEVAHPKKFRVS